MARSPPAPAGTNSAAKDYLSRADARRPFRAASAGPQKANS